MAIAPSWIQEMALGDSIFQKVLVCEFCRIPYLCHYKPLLIRRRSWIQAIHKDRIFWKNLLKNKEMVLENGVKNIQAAAYNGPRTILDNRQLIKKASNFLDKIWKFKPQCCGGRSECEILFAIQPLFGSFFRLEAYCNVVLILFSSIKLSLKYWA